MSEEETSPPPLSPSHPHNTTMTDDHDNHHNVQIYNNHKKPTTADYRYASKHPRYALCCCLTILLLLAGITLLTLYLIYRPHKPHFTVSSLTVLNLTTTTAPPPPSVSAAVQFTIVTTNQNRRVSILYDRLSAYVSYRGQMITQPVALPPLFHERRSRVEMAPVIGGNAGGGCGVCGGGVVAVAPEVAYGLGMDEEFGVVGLSLVLLGKVRWKAGGVTTGRYGIYVKCDVLIRLSKGVVGQVPFVAPPVCYVDV